MTFTFFKKRESGSERGRGFLSSREDFSSTAHTLSHTPSQQAQRGHDLHGTSCRRRCTGTPPTPLPQAAWKTFSGLWPHLLQPQLILQIDCEVSGLGWAMLSLPRHYSQPMLPALHFPPHPSQPEGGHCLLLLLFFSFCTCFGIVEGQWVSGGAASEEVDWSYLLHLHFVSPPIPSPLSTCWINK